MRSRNRHRTRESSRNKQSHRSYSRRSRSERNTSNRTHEKHAPRRRSDSRSPKKYDLQRYYNSGKVCRRDTKYYEERKAKRESLSFSIWDTFPNAVIEKDKRKKIAASDSDARSGSCDSNKSNISCTSKRLKRRRKKTSRDSEMAGKDMKQNSKTSVKSSSKRMKRETKKAKKKKNYASSSEESAHGDNEPVDTNESVQNYDIIQVEKFKAQVQGHREAECDDAEIVGPQPLPDSNETANSSMNYGKALLPGEGAAIAQFVQKNMRIPRRGEVGWNGQDIEQLENLGYVMSGSRHKMMNAIRIRKENQVYTAEEKRALALINFEERQQREHAIMNQFRDMLTERLATKNGS